MLIKPVYFALIFCCLGAPLSRAQVPVTANPNHDAMLASPDSKLAANKRLVYDFFREVLIPDHIDLAPKYLTESYIQHNPEVPTGLAGFVAHFGPKSQPIPISAKLNMPIVSIVAEGDLVVISFASKRPDPTDATKKYTTTWFDMFRIENNKIAEHWDGATLKK
jgi:predicted SnoaL-like aldol condensation-catalyzing enzyme